MVVSLVKIGNKSRRLEVKEIEKEGKKRKRKIKSFIMYMSCWRFMCLRFRGVFKEGSLVNRRIKIWYRF